MKFAKNNCFSILISPFTFALILLLGIPFLSNAQKGKGEIEDTQIIIEKDKKIELPEAVRNFEKVPVQPKSTDRQIQPYKFDDFEVSLADIETKVKVLTAKQDDLKKLYGNYLKLGIGSYRTSYLEGYLNNKRSEKFSYGARVKHLASRYGHVDQENSGNSDNEVGVFGKIFTKAISISASLDYNRERYNFYGYEPFIFTPIPEAEDIKLLYQTFGGKLQFDNNNKDAVLDYHLGFQASTLMDNYDTQENEFGATLNGSYTLASSSKILGNIELWLTNRTDPVNTVNRSFFKLSPHYLFDFEGFLLKLGGNIVYENDSIRTSKIHVLPSAEASYQLIPAVTVYAGVEGNVYRTSLKGFVSENPFLTQGDTLLHTQKPLDLYGGFKGKIISNLAYHLRVSLAEYKNLYFYQNSQTKREKFDILYDSKTTVASYLAELSYSYSDKLNLGLKLEGYGYSLEKLQQHWHRPNYVATFTGRYVFKEKITLSSELYYLNGIVAGDINSGTVKDLDDIVDLNIKVDYKFSSRASAFVHANNILGKNYQRYLYYPTRGFNILAGITFSF